VIRITDRTLSSLDGLPMCDGQALSRFLELLIELDPGAIEMSERVYGLLSPLPEYQRYVLRVDLDVDVGIDVDAMKSKYPRIAEFVCPFVNAEMDKRIRAEMRVDGIDAVVNYADREKVRILGMDGALCGDYLQEFARLREFFRGDLEFCPTDRSHCATALAAEWVMCGAGNNIVASFNGIGGFAPTEEVMMITRMTGLRCVDKNYGFFPEMASLYRKITGKSARPNKPVIGKRIFHVESGVHVDGILKQPMCYEPFPPETVGQARKIILGKQSGVASIRAKLSELRIAHTEENIPLILEMVRARAMEKGGAVTNREFAGIAKGLSI